MREQREVSPDERGNRRYVIKFPDGEYFGYGCSGCGFVWPNFESALRWTPETAAGPPRPWCESCAKMQREAPRPKAGGLPAGLDANESSVLSALEHDGSTIEEVASKSGVAKSASLAILKVQHMKKTVYHNRGRWFRATR